MDHEDTPGAVGSWKSRNCLSPGEYAKSWSLTGAANTQGLIRRICMWVIVLVRVVQTILIITYNTFASRISSIVFGIVFGILSFLFVAWCLAVIDRAQGRRKVLGLAIVRGSLGRPYLFSFVMPFLYKGSCPSGVTHTAHILSTG